MKAAVTEHASQALIESVYVQSWKGVRRITIAATVPVQEPRVMRASGGRIDALLVSMGHPSATVSLTPEGKGDTACLQGVILQPRQSEAQVVDLYLVAAPADGGETEAVYERETP